MPGPPPKESRTGAVLVLLAAACLIALLGFGVRGSYGLFTEPLSAGRGWGREVFAFAVAIQNLVWGVGQPVAGAVADRFGTARVLVVGGFIYALGVALTALADTPLGMYLTAGVLVGLGLSGASFTLVIAALGRLLPLRYQSFGLGFATASASFGQFAVAPLGQSFIAGYGWQNALLLLGGSLLLIPVLAPLLADRSAPARTASQPVMPLRDAVQQAFGERSYLLLVTGFFVCGFHVAFITVHLPAYLVDLGAPTNTAAWAVALIGLFNIVGALTAGALGARYSRRLLLSGLYAGRALTIAVFLLAPKSVPVVLLFAAVMGLLWLSTVPLTSGLVALLFGPRYLGTLFGFVFLSHQVGAFLGVWLGGVLYERFGSYDPVWYVAIALGIMAALVHLPVREEPVPERAAVA